MASLQGKTVLVTGAKGGLGTFVTQACLDAGGTVVGVSRSIADSDFPHASFRAVAAELSSSDSAGKVVERVVADFGKIDTLMHLVGGWVGGMPVVSTSDEVFENMIAMNLRSAFVTIRAVLPAMRSAGSGCVLAVGSKAAVEASAGSAVYAASKAALVSLIRSVAAENADRSIRANIVLPGTMNTAAMRKAMPGVDPSTWVQPEQVANLLVALAGDGLSQVSGAVVPIYGNE